MAEQGWEFVVTSRVPVIGKVFRQNERRLLSIAVFRRPRPARKPRAPETARPMSGDLAALPDEAHAAYGRAHRAERAQRARAAARGGLLTLLLVILMSCTSTSTTGESESAVLTLAAYAELEAELADHAERVEQQSAVVEEAAQVLDQDELHEDEGFGAEAITEIPPHFEWGFACTQDWPDTSSVIPLAERLRVIEDDRARLDIADRLAELSVESVAAETMTVAEARTESQRLSSIADRLEQESADAAAESGSLLVGFDAEACRQSASRGNSNYSTALRQARDYVQSVTQ